MAGDESTIYAALTFGGAAAARIGAAGARPADGGDPAGAAGADAASADAAGADAVGAWAPLQPDLTVIEARRGADVAWRTELAGGGGPLTRSGALVVATLGGTGTVAGVPLRGSPGAVAVGLDAAAGTMRWRLALDSSKWAVITAMSPADGGGVVIGGLFDGTLRADTRLVSSGGKADGFVALVSATGQVSLLVRVGGPGADAVHGVAAVGNRLAIAGTFAPGADLLGTALEARDPRSPLADVFVAELDVRTTRPRWTAVFGGKLDDAVAGVAIDARGRVAVAGVARDVVHVNGQDLRAQGGADALVAWWDKDGAPGPALLFGGAGFDGASAITAAGDRVVIGTFFSGALRTSDRTVTVVGIDDALLVALDGAAIVDTWHAGGPGREEITGLAAVPGGFVAGLAHTEGARVGDAAVAAPRAPLAGAAVMVRPVR